MVSNKDIESVIKMVTYSLILVFKLRNRRITTRKMQIFLSGCHFLRQIRQFVVKRPLDQIAAVPLELIRALLELHSCRTSEIDLGNVLIFSSDFLPQANGAGSWLLVQSGVDRHRWIQAFSLPIKEAESRCLGSPQLIHNLFGPTTSAAHNLQAHLFPETHGIISFAASARVALISFPDAEKLDIETKLKEFFSSPKYVQQGDVVQVSERLSFIVQSVEGPIKSSKKCLGFFIQDRKTSLYQAASVNSMKIPTISKLKRSWPSGTEKPR